MTTTNEPADIEKLRGLLAKATDRPWTSEPSCDEDENVYWSEDLNAPQWTVATPLTMDTATWLIDHIRENDANLIVAAVNALPALLDELESLRAENARLREALERQCDNMSFVLNKASLPDQWYSKFSNELEQDRAALQSKGEGCHG